MNTEIDVTEDEVKLLLAGEGHLTHRQVLGQVMTIYDPLGLVSPVTLVGKLLLRRLNQPKCPKEWDAEIPEAEKKLWGSWWGDLLKSTVVVLPRSVHPKGAFGRPSVIGFSDGSLQAICITLYVVWPVRQATFKSNLLMAKTRVTSALTLTPLVLKCRGSSSCTD